MEALFTIGLTNAVIATLMAVAAAVIARHTRRPTLWYVLWLVVLLRLLVPPVLGVDLVVPEFGGAVSEVATPVIAVSDGHVVAANPGFSRDPMSIAGLLWAAGALVVIGFAIAQLFQLRQILAAASPAPHGITDRVADLGRRLGLRRSPKTVVVDDLVPPMLWAFLGSVRLILPSELLARLDPDEKDTLIAHELAHLSRRDHWVRHLELAVLALFWWNPVAWWATKRVRRAQELCCDHRVAGLLPDRRRAYADCLVETARFLSGRRLPLGSPARAMADLSQLKGRIQMIMTTDRSRNLSITARSIAAAILLAVLAITPMLTAQTESSDDLGRPITLNLKDADLHEVLATFSKISAVEILVESGVTGKVTATFNEVPWDQALAKIIQDQGLMLERSGDQMIVRLPPGERLAKVQPVGTGDFTRLAGRRDGTEVFRYIPDGRISEPVAVDRVPPKYPAAAREAGVTGVVVADLEIDEVGLVRDVLIQESPSDELSTAAIDALEQWRFEPAVMDGEAVAVRYIVTVKFNLK